MWFKSGLLLTHSRSILLTLPIPPEDIIKPPVVIRERPVEENNLFQDDVQVLYPREY